MSDNSYIIYSDGGCNPNPGGPGGFGTVILQDNIIFTELSKGFFSSTNNRMEIMGVIAALEYLPKGSIIETLYCDSQYVLKCISGEFARKKNLDLWERFDKAAKNVEIRQLKWVKGHNKNKYNERCDSLATLALKHPSTVDVGYIPENHQLMHPEKEKLQTDIPEDMRTPIFYPSDNLNATCKKAIETFNKKDLHVFGDYVSLKTGGKDIFSSADVNDLSSKIETIKNGVCDFVEKSGINSKQKESAYRWIMRGISPADAVRKVQVDAEVTKNALTTKK